MTPELMAILNKAEVKGFGLVRDRNGFPKIDDLSALPTEIKEQLTAEELAYLKEKT